MLDPFVRLYNYIFQTMELLTDWGVHVQILMVESEFKNFKILNSKFKFRLLISSIFLPFIIIDYIK